MIQIMTKLGSNLSQKPHYFLTEIILLIPFFVSFFASLGSFLTGIIFPKASLIIKAIELGFSNITSSRVPNFLGGGDDWELACIIRAMNKKIYYNESYNMSTNTVFDSIDFAVNNVSRPLMVALLPPSHLLMAAIWSSVFRSISPSMDKSSMISDSELRYLVFTNIFKLLSLLDPNN